jgi:hypothetical protein
MRDMAPRGTGNPMDFGIHTGAPECLAARAHVITPAQRTEVLGHAYLSIADHHIVPVRSTARTVQRSPGCTIVLTTG